MRINVTSVLVDDQDKAVRLYTEVLGFVKKTEAALRGRDRRPCRPRRAEGRRPGRLAISEATWQRRATAWARPSTVDGLAVRGSSPRVGSNRFWHLLRCADHLPAGCRPVRGSAKDTQASAKSVLLGNRVADARTGHNHRTRPNRLVTRRIGILLRKSTKLIVSNETTGPRAAPGNNAPAPAGSWRGIVRRRIHRGGATTGQSRCGRVVRGRATGTCPRGRPRRARRSSRCGR